LSGKSHCFGAVYFNLVEALGLFDPWEIPLSSRKTCVVALEPLQKWYIKRLLNIAKLLAFFRPQKNFSENVDKSEKS